MDDVKGDTHGEFEDLLVALITPPALYDCHEVMRAMKVGYSPLFFYFCLTKELYFKQYMYEQNQLVELNFS